jgi:glycosyltransferase involved in cell wall biosynthesis
MSLRLSVGIPVYNQVSTIGQTIESLLDQQVAPFEIVVSDNHSTDGTSRVIAGYSDRLKIVSPPVHLPGINHFNFCFCQMSGDWLALMCGDDQAYPNYVSELLSLASMSADAVLVTANFDLLDHQTGAKTPFVRLSLSPGVNSGKKMTKKLLFSGKMGSCAFAVKSTAFHKTGGFDERFASIFEWSTEWNLSFAGFYVYSRRVIFSARIKQIRPAVEEERSIPAIKEHINSVNHKLPEAASQGIALSVIIKAFVPHLSRYYNGPKALSSGHSAMENLQEALATLGGLVIAESSPKGAMSTVRSKVSNYFIRQYRKYVTAVSSRWNPYWRNLVYNPHIKCLIF